MAAFELGHNGRFPPITFLARGDRPSLTWFLAHSRLVQSPHHAGEAACLESTPAPIRLGDPVRRILHTAAHKLSRAPSNSWRVWKPCPMSGCHVAALNLSSWKHHTAIKTMDHPGTAAMIASAFPLVSFSSVLSLSPASLLFSLSSLLSLAQSKHHRVRKHPPFGVLFAFDTAIFCHSFLVRSRILVNPLFFLLQSASRSLLFIDFTHSSTSLSLLPPPIP